MTLKELRYVVAVAGELHFGRAAEKCFVSQPALSLAVQKLEEELDVKIFERRRNDVMVTPVGALIVQQARRALEEIDAIKEFAHGGRDQLSGVFRLGVINSVGPYLLPELVPALHRIAPRMPLEIEEGLTANLEAMLKRGALDAIVIALPFDSAGVETRELFDEAFPPARSEQPSVRKAKNDRQRRPGRREAAVVARRALLPRSGARCVSRVSCATATSRGRRRVRRSRPSATWSHRGSASRYFPHRRSRRGTRTVCVARFRSNGRRRRGRSVWRGAADSAASRRSMR